MRDELINKGILYEAAGSNFVLLMNEYKETDYMQIAEILIRCDNDLNRAKAELEKNII